MTPPNSPSSAIAPENRLATLLADLRHARVLVCGDIILDRFVFGAMERISREAPIPVFATTRHASNGASNRASNLGGAGLVWENLCALGATASLVGITGADEAGDEVASYYGQELVRADSGGSSWATPIKTRYLVGKNQVFRTDEGTALGAAENSFRQSAHQAAEKALGGQDLLLLSDYGYDLLGDDLTPKLIAVAGKQKKLVVVDPRGTDWSRYQGADYITPNLQELSDAHGAKLESEAEIISAAEALRVRYKLGAVLVTRGSDGMSLVRDSGHERLLVEAREVHDVTGAGDTVIATFSAALACGATPIEAMRLANAAASLVVAKVGPVAVSAEVLRTYLTRGWHGFVEKIATADQAEARVAAWRTSGARIGFTNGCFDILHAGHLSSLAAARRNCDRLIVGLNDDDSVRRLKGENRPLQPLDERAALLASLSLTDLVVPFAEDTPAELIARLLPDLLVKGADYEGQELPGAKAVEKNGGTVLLVPLVPQRSTTRLVAGAESGEKVTNEKPSKR